MKIGKKPRNLIQMKNGKEYIIKFSEQAEKNKTNLKSSGLDKSCKNILVLMKRNTYFKNVDTLH